MPRGDGTGPMGMGPMTGRGAGYCAGFPTPGFMSPAGGRLGLGLGGGRGRGFRAYPGYGPGRFPAAFYPGYGAAYYGYGGSGGFSPMPYYGYGVPYYSYGYGMPYYSLLPRMW